MQSRGLWLSVSFVALCALGCSSPPHPPSPPADAPRAASPLVMVCDFGDQDVDLREVCENLSRRQGVNIAIDPALAPCRVTVPEKGWRTFGEAIAAVASQAGARVEGPARGVIWLSKRP